MTKSEFFRFAHSIAKLRNIAFYGSYQKAFGAVLRDLHAKGYRAAVPAFRVVEPFYKRNMYVPETGQWVTL